MRWCTVGGLALSLICPLTRHNKPCCGVQAICLTVDVGGQVSTQADGSAESEMDRHTASRQIDRYILMLAQCLLGQSLGFTMMSATKLHVSLIYGRGSCVRLRTWTGLLVELLNQCEEHMANHSMNTKKTWN